LIEKKVIQITHILKMQVFRNVTPKPLRNSYQIYSYLHGMYDLLGITDPEEGPVILRNNSNYFKKNIKWTA